MGEGEVVFSEWVKLKTISEDQQWTARTVGALVAPKLSYPVILGGPFLKSNKIVIDHETGSVVTKGTRYQLLPLQRPAEAQRQVPLDAKAQRKITERQ